MVQAVIVAAGIGSRLYPISEIIPKIMLPVGVTEQPLALKIIEHCKDHGIVDFLFCLNKKMGQQVANFLGSGARFGVNIKYSTTSEPLGTAGELRIAWERELIEGKSLIYYGDTLCSTDLTDMMELHEQDGGDISIVVNDNIRIPVGYVEDCGLVTRILEKPTLAELYTPTSERWSAGGILPIFYVTRDAFYSVFCGVNKDVVGDVLKEMLDSYNILAYHDKNPFLDIGDFKNYILAKKWE